MSYSTSCFRDRQPGRHVPEGQQPPRTADSPWVYSLRRIVRRILRTQSRRTGFEARVLEEAHRLVDGRDGETTRDTLERLVVDQLLLHPHDSRFELAGHGAGALCPATQRRVSNSTFACQSVLG